MVTILKNLEKTLYKKIMKNLGLTIKDKNYLIIFIVILLYVILFTSFFWLRYLSFHVMAYDFGIFEQSFWNTIHGKGLFYNTVEGTNHLFVNFSPIMFLILPFYAIFPHPLTLIILQNLAIALSGIFVYKIAKKRLGNKKLSLLITLLYYLYPPLWGVTIDDFHPEAFAIPFLFGAFYFLFEEKKIMYGLLFAILALMCKQTVALTIIGLATYGIISKRINKSTALILYALSILELIIYLLLPTPPTGYKPSRMYYSYIINNINNPIIVLKGILSHLFCFNSMSNIIGLLAPLLFLPILSLEMYISILNLISVHLADMISPMLTSQYWAEIIPFVIVGFIYILSRFNENTRKKILILSFVVMILIAIWAINDPRNRLFKEIEWPSEEDFLIKDILNKYIPQNGTLLATTTLFPYTFKREGDTYLLDGFPPTYNNYPKADYIIIDFGNYWSLPPHINWDNLTKNMGVYLYYDGIILYKRGYHGFPVKIEPNTRQGYLIMEFYKGKFNKKIFSTISSRLKYDFGTLSPVKGVVPKDNFSIKLKGLLYAPISGKYIFYVSADDAIELYIDGKKVAGTLNRYIVKDKGVIYLKKGWHSIEIKYYEWVGASHFEVKWKTPISGSFGKIPEKYLAPYPPNLSN